jgi:hypothetical protein
MAQKNLVEMERKFVKENRCWDVFIVQLGPLLQSSYS